MCCACVGADEKLCKCEEELKAAQAQVRALQDALAAETARANSAALAPPRAPVEQALEVQVGHPVPCVGCAGVGPSGT